MINKSKYDEPQYFCDRCNKEISYKDKTLHKIYVETEYNKRKKLYDLCSKCFRSFKKGVSNK
jgi:uncharacterized protein with PIN domain